MFRSQWNHARRVLRIATMGFALSAFTCPERNIFKHVNVMAPACLPLPVGDTVTVTAYVGTGLFDVTTPTGNATFTVTPESIAVITSAGVLTGVRPGIAMVSATYEGAKSSPTAIPVIGSAGPLILEPATVSVSQGSYFAVTATMNDVHGAPIQGLVPELVGTDFNVLQHTGGLNFYAANVGTAKIHVCMATHRDSVTVQVGPPAGPTRGAGHQ